MGRIHEYGKEPASPKHPKLKSALMILALVTIGLLTYGGLIAKVFAQDMAHPLSGDGVTIEVGFSPDQGATDRLVTFIAEARKSIRVAAYSFTSPRIAKALLDAHKRGVDVKVVMDKSQASARYTSYTFLKNANVSVRINRKYAIMHSKYIIVDEMNLETGSFNFTKAAEEKNAENILIFRNAQALSRQYLDNWQVLWDEAE